MLLIPMVSNMASYTGFPARRLLVQLNRENCLARTVKLGPISSSMMTVTALVLLRFPPVTVTVIVARVSCLLRRGWTLGQPLRIHGSISLPTVGDLSPMCLWIWLTNFSVLTLAQLHVQLWSAGKRFYLPLGTVPPMPSMCPLARMAPATLDRIGTL